VLADDAPGGQAATRERLRLERALASLARLGHRAPVAAALASFDAFAAPFGGAAAPRARAAGTAVPVRRQGSPLPFQRHGTEGYERLDAAAREALWTFDAGAEPQLLEAAWFAADGRRTLDEIAALVALEPPGSPDVDVAALFDWTARLGRSHWA